MIKNYMRKTCITSFACFLNCFEQFQNFMVCTLCQPDCTEIHLLDSLHVNGTNEAIIPA